MSYYSKQGAGENRLPHLLVATIDTHWNSGIKWVIQCPYEADGKAEGCGIVEECNGTPDDVAKWDCLLFPESPSDHPPQLAAMSDEERAAAWSEFEAKREVWDEAHDWNRWHRTTECWYATVAIPNSDFDPEYFLADISRGTPINGPLKVLVGYEGSDEDTEPKFRLWEEPDGAQTS
jgi:hypothetical protein